MKEKYLLFKDGTKKRIIKECPTIVNDKRWACYTREYVTSDGTVYKLFYSMTEGDHWCERCVSDLGGEEYYVYCKNIDEVVEEDDCAFTSNFALPEYCVMEGKKCCHCHCEVAGYCQARTSDPVDVFKALNKRIENLLAENNDQELGLSELSQKVYELEKENEKLKAENKSLDKRNTNLNVEVLEKQEQIRKLEKDNYIANDNLTAIAAENMKLRDENTKLKEKVDVYNKEVKQWLNGFYGQPLQPLYCCAGARSGGKTLFTENDKLKKELEYYKGRCANQKTELMEHQKYIKKVVSDRNDYKQALRILGSNVFTYNVYRSLDGSFAHRIDSTIKTEDEYQFVKDMINKARM